MVLCDLPYDERYLIKNIIILGIWYGTIKPPMESVLKNIFASHIQHNHIYFKNNDLSFIVRIKYFIADKPARSSVLGMQSSNSKFFCPVCLAQTNVLLNGQRRSIICDFDQEMQKRTNAGFSSCAYSAQITGRPDYGIKSVSFLLSIANIDIVDFNLFDYMHSVCLGIFKDLINLVFFTQSQNQVNRHIAADYFDNIIKDFKYSGDIASVLPPLTKIKIWKAKDYKNFFLHILPIGLDYLGSIEHRKCLEDLRNGVYLLLCKDAISNADLVKDKFNSFLSSVSRLYGKSVLKPNFHDLFHLPDMVKSSGPLYEYSGFNFENINGILSRMCKGNKRLDIQVTKKILLLIESLYFEEKTKSRLCKEYFLWTSKSFKWKNCKFSMNGVDFFGKSRESSKYSCFFHNSSFPNIIYFNRASFLKKKISTSDYDQNRQRVFSALIILKDNTFLNLLEIVVDKNSREIFLIAEIHTVSIIMPGIYKLKEFISVSRLDFFNVFFQCNFCSIVRDHVILTPFLELN